VHRDPEKRTRIHVAGFAIPVRRGRGPQATFAQQSGSGLYPILGYSFGGPDNPATLKDATYRRRYRLFLEQLKQARVEAGLTQSDVARHLGRPQSFVSKAESGERRLDLIEADELARLYRKPIDFFLRID
jgi:DNA-binding transcriptional regulator YiaG